LSTGQIEFTNNTKAKQHKIKQPRHKALAIVMCSWQLGMMIGPTMGGFLSNAADKYQTLDTPFIRQYAYALPMLIIAGLSFFSAVVGYVYLEETAPGLRKEDAQSTLPPVAKLKHRRSDLGSSPGGGGTGGGGGRGSNASDSDATNLGGEEGEAAATFPKQHLPPRVSATTADSNAHDGGADATANPTLKTGFAIFRDPKPFWATSL
jgi:hypothetical protein